MPDHKKPSTPTRLDKPVLSLSKPKPISRKKNKTKVESHFNFKKSNSVHCDPKKNATSDKKNPHKDLNLIPKQKPKNHAEKVGTVALASRRVIYDVLAAVEEGIQLDKALASNQGLPKLDDRDRRFVRLLATTCLRCRGQLEKVLAPLVARRPFGAQNNANLILLMGAAQLLLLKTGAHAAVDSTVELMRQTGFDRLCGLANAVMRRLTREGDALLETTSAMDNLPSWLKQSWRHYWGEATTTAIANLAMLPPPLDISVKDDPAGWAVKLGAQHIDSNSLRREFDGEPSLLEGFEDGAWWVQDAAAALPARLLNLATGQTVIDLCAAPGGKTAQLIAAGGNVTAIDNSQKRLDRLRRNLKRLKLSANLILCDGKDYNPETQVDAVLVDAPCSATGTIRRRPDILNRRDAPDINLLQQIQWQLTTDALGWLRIGGQLVYATCSLQPEEGEDVVSAIITAANGKYTINTIKADEAGIFARSITDDGYLRILPSDYLDIGGVDGFFIARLTCLE